MYETLAGALPLPASPGPVELGEGGSLPSAFRVGDLAQAAVATAGAALSSLVAARTGRPGPAVAVDRDLAEAWFGLSIRPQGWELPPAWDPVAGDYRTADGWIRLHTNAPHHRAAALAVLGTPVDRALVAAEVEGWKADDLEEAVVAAGGAAAAMRSEEAWAAHPQGTAAASEPLLAWTRTEGRHHPVPGGAPGRPLAGVRVLDLTRVLAGPVATRLLAGWGAQVLRIDAPGWDEPAVVPEVTVGKRCARLDLRTDAGRGRMIELLRHADVLVHGYRSDALDGLGLGAEVRQAERPGLVDVSLDAYGWSGPWSRRRGFDSLVQMSSGIASTGGAVAGADRPVPLPVQALDHATGYLLAAAALCGLALRHVDGGGSRWQASLARTAAVLTGAGRQAPDLPPPGGPLVAGAEERTSWGVCRRLAPPLAVTGAPLRWDLPARPLGSDDAAW